MLYKNKKGQAVGELKEDGVFRKRVDSTKHYMKIMSGYGLDKSILDSLQEKECVKIKIMEDDKKVYEIALPDFLNHAVERDFGHGKQMFCSLKFFTCIVSLQ